METRAEDSGMTGRPTLASSWDTANGVLSRSLLLTRAGVGAQDFDWEELLVPPASGCAVPRGSRVVALGDSHAPGETSGGRGAGDLGALAGASASPAWKRGAAPGRPNGAEVA